jgi:hypothetical protein
MHRKSFWSAVGVLVAIVAGSIIAESADGQAVGEPASDPPAAGAFEPAREDSERAAAAQARLRALDRLVGRWRISGDAEGEVVYEWLAGGHFLLQRVDIKQYGRSIKGIEVIGYVRPFGGERSAEIMSRWYDNEGNTFDYVYEMEGETLRIWGGERGSAAHYVGRLSKDGNELSGRWTYPGGGGYSAVARRVK